jgi:hypothetical protein
MMIEQNNINGEDLSQIQTLTDQMNALTLSRDRWNNAYMVLVPVSVLLAAFVFIAQFIAGRKSKKLEEIQGSLIAAKDRNSGQKIAAAGLIASQADERSRILEQGNLKLQGAVASLQTEASTQKERAATAERALLELQEHNKPRRLSEEQAERGQYQFDSSYASNSVTRTPGPIVARLDINAVSVLVLSKTYVTHKADLLRYENSTMLRNRPESPSGVTPGLSTTMLSWVMSRQWELGVCLAGGERCRRSGRLRS